MADTTDLRDETLKAMTQEITRLRKQLELMTDEVARARRSALYLGRLRGYGRVYTIIADLCDKSMTKRLPVKPFDAYMRGIMDVSDAVSQQLLTDRLQSDTEVRRTA